MKQKADKEARFLSITENYKNVIAKVCILYMSQTVSFDDLYQDVLLNIWQGMDTFRGDAKISTWIYRMAINTCITSHRHSSRHCPEASITLENLVGEPADCNDGQAFVEECRELYSLISRLDPLDKALISLWLDEKPYDEIAAITGISPANVAVKIHRIKQKLKKMAHKENN